MFIILLSLLHFSAFAQDNFDLKQSDFEVLKPLKPRNTNLDYEKKLAVAHAKKRQAELESIIESGDHLVSLERDSLLEDLDSKEVFILKREINAYVYRLVDSNGCKYIKDKSGKVRFKVEQRYVHDLNYIADLKPNPKHFTEIARPIDVQNIERLKKFITQFNFHFEAHNSRYMQEVAEKRYDQMNSGNRLESVFYLHWEFPVELGASVNYQSYAYTTVTSGDAKFRALNIGPVVRFDVGEWGNSPLKMHFSYQQDFGATYTYRINDAVYTNVMKQNAAEIGLERLTQNKYGRFILGLNYRRSMMATRQTSDSSLKTSSGDRSANSLGLYLGQDVDFNL